MRRFLTLLVAGVLCVAPGASRAARGQSARDTLDIYFIDTEGGQATLYVSPAGQTLLVDTGNAGARDLDRIVAVLAVAGVTRLDHLFLTHYHGDHYGNLIELATRFRVAHLYDHGASVEGDVAHVAAFEKRYADLSRTTPRTIVKPGDAIPLGGVDTTVVVSHSRALAAPLANAPGAGAANGACATVRPREEAAVDDNHQSAGFAMAYGRFRTVNLGDLTWSREFALMCPANPIGTVDLYLTTHHGLERSGSPAFVHAIRPRVAVMNNGTRKGGAVQSFQTLESSPGLEDVWQLHWSYAGGIEHNAPGVMIANLDEPAQLAAVVGTAAAAPPAAAATPAAALPAGPGGDAAHAPAHYLKVSARADGSFTVTNSRNGYAKTYAARP